MRIITPGKVHDMNSVRRNALSHALVLHDLGRKQFQSAPFWFALDNDVFAVDTLLLASLTSLARAKLGREQVRAKCAAFLQRLHSGFL